MKNAMFCFNTETLKNSLDKSNIKDDEKQKIIDFLFNDENNLVFIKFDEKHEDE